MRLAFILSCVVAISVNASIYSQNAQLQLEIKEKPIREVLKKIEDQSLFRFFYNDEFTDLNKLVSISIENKTIDDVLSDIFSDSEVSYKVLNNNFIVCSRSSGGIIPGSGHRPRWHSD